MSKVCQEMLEIEYESERNANRESEMKEKVWFCVLLEYTLRTKGIATECIQNSVMNELIVNQTIGGKILCAGKKLEIENNFMHYKMNKICNIALCYSIWKHSYTQMPNPFSWDIE